MRIQRQHAESCPCTVGTAFFVTGSHEYYSGAEEWIAEMRCLGLTVLMNQHVVRERDQLVRLVPA
jgi:uncharacterized protein